MSKKILVVDDSRTALMVVTSILSQRTRYSISTAENGSRAVMKAMDEKPDLILMDVVMPLMNGFEACSELRQLESTANIPVILLTTRGEEECVEAGFRSGCNDYLTKPVTANELLPIVEAYLGA